MTKSLFVPKVLVAVAVALSFSASQALQAQPANCTTAVCNAICAQAPWGSGTICKAICPTAGSAAITAGCQSTTPCATICSTGALSKISSFCNTACNAAGPAITTACQPCVSSSPSEGDQPTL